MSQPLPREMQPHTYLIMREVEDKHWWYVGRRRIIESFVQRICDEIRKEGKGESRILDIGCGTGGNLESLTKFGKAEGVDISRVAIDFCRARGFVNVIVVAADNHHISYDSMVMMSCLYVCVTY